MGATAFTQGLPVSPYVSAFVSVSASASVFVLTLSLSLFLSDLAFF